MGPEHFFQSGMWIIPVVMMILCFLFFKSGIMSKGRFFMRRGDDSGSSQQSENSALDILKKRYANGEISKAEFEEMKKDL